MILGGVTAVEKVGSISLSARPVATRDDLDLIVVGSLGSVDRCQDRSINLGEFRECADMMGDVDPVSALVTPAARLASGGRLGFDASPGYRKLDLVPFPNCQ
jgi:hypothetical protein